jgi:hypothetical protein
MGRDSTEPRYGVLLGKEPLQKPGQRLQGVTVLMHGLCALPGCQLLP